MPRLRSLQQGMSAQGQAEETFPIGSFAYGLNIYLEATNGVISVNSKRMDRTFRLTSVNTANLGTTVNWSLILGTEKVDWFADYLRAETILGDGVLPHFLPSEGMIIEKGDSIMVHCRNDSAVAKRIALLFQGEHI